MAVAGAMLAVRLLEEWLIFWPTDRLFSAPQRINLPVEDVELEPVPGIHIFGWFVPHPSPRAAVLYLEGNGSNRSTRLGEVALLGELGCSVLIVDYEGYGVSEGRPSEDALYRDARAARNWIRTDPRTRDLPLILLGESLGGAVAIRLAREEPPAGLVVISSFVDIASVVRKACKGVPLDRVLRSRYPSLENIRYYHGPILIIHGEDDELIPIHHGKRLFQAADGRKGFLAIPHAGHNHNELRRIGGRVYRLAIARFLDEVSGPHSRVDTASLF